MYAAWQAPGNAAPVCPAGQTGCDIPVNASVNAQIKDGALYVANTPPGNNIGFLVFNGNVGIGDATPASMFTVGNGDLFQINSAGNIGAGVAPSASYKLQVSGGVTKTTGGLVVEVRTSSSPGGGCNPTGAEEGRLWLATSGC